jgi:hypothetical protein
VVRKNKKILSEDDLVVLDTFASSDSFKVVSKLLETLAYEQLLEVLHYDLNNGSETRLAYTKKSSEGAEKLVRDFKIFLDKLRTKSVNGVRR